MSTIQNHSLLRLDLGKSFVDLNAKPNDWNSAQQQTFPLLLGRCHPLIVYTLLVPAKHKAAQGKEIETTIYLKQANCTETYKKQGNKKVPTPVASILTEYV